MAEDPSQARGICDAADTPSAGDSGSGPATLLRVLVKQRHWQKFETFQAQFTRVARNLAQREEEPWLAGVTVSRRSWDRWMTGNVKTEPRPDACRVLEHMFGYPVGDLLAPASEASVLRIREEARQTTGAPHGNDPGGAVKDQARTIDALSPASSGTDPLEGTPVTSPARDGTWDVEDMERRELLRLLGSMAAVAPLAGGLNAETVRRNLDSSLNAPTIKSDVDEWERVLAQYSAGNWRVPPAVVLPGLLADMDEAQLRLKEAPEQLRPPMARVCGYLGALAAMNYFNAGDEQSANRYWRTALRIIDQSDDRSAQAELRAHRAMFLLLGAQPSPSAGLALADEAVGIGGGKPCAGTANGYAGRAQALALLGGHGESAQTLQDLSDTFARMPEAQGSARSSWGYSEQSLRFIEGFVYASAGRVPEASRALDAGRSLIPDGQWIAATSFEVTRGLSLIRGGDPSEGARLVVRAVQAMPTGFRASGATRRAALALEAVPADAANVPAVTEARELLSLPSAP